MVELREELKEIKELLVETKEKKEKKFRLPFTKKVSPRSGSKGYITLLKINENGFIDIKKEKIEDQTIMVDGIPRLAPPNVVLHWKKNPILILPSWSVKPFSPADNYEESEKEKMNTKGYKILLDKMKKETVGSKPQMGNMIKWILGLGLLAIIIYAFVTSGG